MCHIAQTNWEVFLTKFIDVLSERKERNYTQMYVFMLLALVHLKIGLTTNSCSGSMLSFADDTTLITSHANLLDLYTIANRNINELFMWFCANKLSLNAGKN